MLRLHTTSRVEALGTVALVVLVVALVATSTGRNALARIYLQSTETIERSVHLPFPLVAKNWKRVRWVRPLFV